MSAWLDSLAAKVPGIDTETGLLYSGGLEDLYQEIVESYASENLAIPLDESYQNEDWQKYATTVHGIKSTSLTIGLVLLSEEAKALEFAAKEANIDYIHQNHKAFCEKYKSILENLA